ncbi:MULTISPECIES: serpin family protein [Streptacidiphilus]|uniref:Serpin family protein n=1 Tax=Streptacidiphilus cavernicola TaxID=3342716 RepID=A0ABV6UVY7_9ACTN|nr:serpin family protein [Streptacidiphilus jeojiense]
MSGLLLATALTVLTGCGSANGGGGNNDRSADGTLVRVSAAAAVAPAADRQAAADGGTVLGLDLLRQLAGSNNQAGKQNLAVSPASLQGALALLLPGAQGATADEIRKLLGTRLSAAEYATALGTLRRDEQAQAAKDHNQLSYADDLWAQQGLKLDQTYLRTLATAFATGVHTADFAHHADQATDAINATVSQETRKMITKLFDRGALGSDTRLVLTDALYLHADWASPFDPHQTSQADFHLADGSTVPVETMRSEHYVSTASIPGWQAAELPYQGGHLAMDLLLPDSATSTRLPTGAQLAAAVAALGSSQQQAGIRLPKFHFEYGGELSGALRALGMRTAFTGDADLGAITTDHTPLQVSTVVQRTKVDVDEQGTTAAAATGVGVGMGAVAPARIQLDFDHPFVFAVRDTTTGQILFLGQVLDPLAS